MTETIAIRRATQDDNDALINLARRCPQRGKLHIYSDRYPDFFAMNRLQSESSMIYVAHNVDGKIIASVSLFERAERHGDRHLKVLHVCDIRTDPDHRRSRAATEFLRLYQDLLTAGGYDHGVAEILEGNDAIIKTQRFLESGCRVYNDGFVRFTQLVPARSYRVSSRWSYRKAHTEDLEAIAFLLNQNYSDCSGFPPVSTAWLSETLSLHPSFAIDDMWVAVDASGTIVACAGLWDQSSIRKTIATQFSPTIKRIVRVLNVVGLLWKLPPPPIEGQALRFLFLRWPAARNKDPEPLSALCRFLMNRVRRLNVHQFVAIGFHEHDPLRHCLKGMIKADENIHIFTHYPKETSSPDRIDDKTAGRSRFVDLSLV